MHATTYDELEKVVAVGAHLDEIAGVEYDVTSQIVGVRFAVLTLWLADPIGTPPELVQVGSTKYRDGWNRWERWYAPTLVGRVTIGRVESVVRNDSILDGGQLRAMQRSRGVEIEVGRSLEVRASAVDVTFEVTRKITGYRDVTISYRSDGSYSGWSSRGLPS
jgi:hypothetical protein